jgi:hypothetical protein
MALPPTIPSSIKHHASGHNRPETSPPLFYSTTADCHWFTNLLVFSLVWYAYGRHTLVRKPYRPRLLRTQHFPRLRAAILISSLFLAFFFLHFPRLAHIFTLPFSSHVSLLCFPFSFTFPASSLPISHIFRRNVICNIPPPCGLRAGKREAGATFPWNAVR